MDKEHVKGAIDKAKGSVKDAVGGLTGDTKTQVEGKIEKRRAPRITRSETRRTL